MPQLRRGVTSPRRRTIGGTRLKTRRFHGEIGGTQMKLFSCQGCGQLLYFENVRCENCGRALGYLPDLTEISALDPKPEGGWSALAAQGVAYKFCRNNEQGVCNWMVPADGGEEFCAACRHNRMIPDLSVPGNQQLWAKIETAKHRLFYGLLRLGLPLENRNDAPGHGLAFDFLQDPPESHAQNVMTGHDNGLITLVTTNLEGHSNYRTIEDLQANLDRDMFWRVHRSFLVNIHRIREVIPWFKSSFQLRMDDKKQTEIPVSRVQTKRLRALLKL